jgi:hypothetical protein
MKTLKVNQYKIENGKAYVWVKTRWVQTVLDQKLLDLVKKYPELIKD